MHAYRCQPIDVLRGLTILSITAFHFYVDTRGGSGNVTAALFAGALDAADWRNAFDIAARTLVALPSYRLDVLLFLTGVVLMLSKPSAPGVFWRHRARAVMPGYWLATLAATILLVVLAMLRSGVKGTELAAEIADGTLLARAPYHFEFADVARSVTVVGRLEDVRTMQVISPSLWYVVLMLQCYLLFPALRWLLNRIGPIGFLSLCTGAMFGGRALVLGGWAWPGFGVEGTLLYFLPFRLVGPALGMVAARWVDRASAPPARWISMALFAPAMAVLLWSVWIGAATRTTVSGPMIPVVIGLPALWVIASSVLHSRRATAMLTWVGTRSLSVLVVQDLLRLVTGTVTSIWGRLDPLTWCLLPVYLLVAVALTPCWQALVTAAVARVERRRTLRTEASVVVH